MSRRHLRRAAASSRGGRLTSLALGAAIAVFVFAAVAFSWNNREFATPSAEGMTPIVVESPRPSQAVTPTPTPTPTPTAPPGPDCSEPWKFTRAWMTIEAAGIIRQEITEYTKADLVTDTFWSETEQRWIDVHNALVPRDNDAIAWYSGITKGKSIPSACATNTAYFAGHSLRPEWGEAVFTKVPSLPVGTEMIIETETERLTYTLQPAEGKNADGTPATGGSFTINKLELTSDERHNRIRPLWAVLTTCFADGEFVEGHSVNSVDSMFKLTEAEYLVKPTPTPTPAPSSEPSPRVAGPLF